MEGINKSYLERSAGNKLPVPESNIKEFLRQSAKAYTELLAYYHCALMEVETKFNVLNKELSLNYDRNPIEHIKTRIKSFESIVNKLAKKGAKISVGAIEENLSDVAGIRIICGFKHDIYALAEAFLNQDDVTLIEKKDYILNPKPNGYRSLHLIVEIPIFLHDQKKKMKVEIQFRTISMDCWASLEHKLTYKKGKKLSKKITKELYDCSCISAELDERMEKLQFEINKIK